MSIKESMLNIVSDLAQNDYIRAVTYGGYSRRVEVSELAKSVVEDYTGSSLAGENQSVQGAFSALETEIQNVEQDVTAEINDAIVNILPTDTAAGEIASFPDGSDLSPALSVVAGIEPVQDLHGYDAPWVGGAGKNKLDFSKLYQGTFDLPVQTNLNNVSYDGYIQLESGAQYTWSAVVPQSGGRYLRFYDSNKSELTGERKIDYSANPSITFTMPSTAVYVRVMWFSNVQILVADCANSQIEQGSTATAWTPYENICPITGWTGCEVEQTGNNLLKTTLTSQTSFGLTFSGNADGSISIQGTSTGTYPQVVVWNKYKDVYPKNTDVTLSVTTTGATPTGAKVYAIAYERDAPNDANVESHSTKSSGTSTFQITHDYVIVSLVAEGNGLTYTDTKAYCQIELGTTATTYEQYNGTTYTTTLPSTTYGGTLDVVSGVLTVTHGFITFDGSEDWSNVGVQYPQAFQLNTGVTNAKQGASDLQDNMSNMFPNALADVVQQGIRWQAYQTNGRLFVYDDTHLSDLAGFKAMLQATHLQLRYELATPTTTQLTPQQVATLLGTNNVWSDAGDMSVTYKADIQLYIDKQTNELRVAILALS